MNKMTTFERNMSVEDDWVAVKNAPFSENENYSLPAVAVDWSSVLTAFNVTLLTVNYHGTEERLWSDSFSISKIRRRHFEMCLVFPEIDRYFPAIPQESPGLWGYLRWIRVTPKHCKRLEEYIKQAFTICGWKLFASVFFEEPLCDEDFTIPTLQLKRSKYEQEVERSVEKFEQYFAKKGDVESIVNLVQWYENLDVVVGTVQEAEKKLLKFDCEPFEELRDITQKERSLLNQQCLTESTVDVSSQGFCQWEEQYIESVTKINGFQTAYFASSLPRLSDVLQVMKDDRLKLTENGYEQISEKIEHFEKDVLKIEVKLLNCNHQTKILERDRLRQETLALDNILITEEVLAAQEVAFYKKQYEILQIQCKIQDKHEIVARLDLKKFDVNDNDVDEAVRTKKEKLSQSLSNIARKKALLRNKMRECEAEIRKMSEKKMEKQEQLVTHHAVQMKIERRREEIEAKKTERLEERQKTLLRLKEYKHKYTKPKEVKPPRYQPPSVRGKKDEKTKNASTSEKASRKKKNGDVKTRNEATATNIPQSTTAIPQGTTAIPQAATITPQGTTVTPQGTTATPQGTTATPQGATATPQGTTIIPQSTRTVPPCPPPPPPLAPPPPPPPPPPVGSTQIGQTGLMPVLVERKGNTGVSSSFNQPSSLSNETIELDALLLARNRLKKNAAVTAENSGGAGSQGFFPAGQELTRAIQSVKLRKTPVNQVKPTTDLSQDGAEFLRKALERMNRFTTLSDNEDEDTIEQDW